jgi:hypothetical protein
MKLHPIVLNANRRPSRKCPLCNRKYCAIRLLEIVHKKHDFGHKRDEIHQLLAHTARCVVAFYP